MGASTVLHTKTCIPSTASAKKLAYLFQPRSHSGWQETANTHSTINTMIQTAKDANMIKVVSKNTAKNPVARAVARAKLHSTLMTQKIALYMMDKGSKCAELMEGLSTTLAVIGYAFEWQHRKGSEADRNTPEIRVLRGGLSACHMMMDTDYYDPLNTVAIANALDAAESINKKLEADSIQRAWLALCK